MRSTLEVLKVRKVPRLLRDFATMWRCPPRTAVAEIELGSRLDFADIITFYYPVLEYTDTQFIHHI